MIDNKLTGKKSKRFFKRKEKLILLGIFEHPEHGILLIETPYGQLQLPGGKFLRSAIGTDPEGQTTRETMKLQRRIFEKSGLLLQVEGCYDSYLNGRQKALIKVFLLTQNSIPLNEQPWQRDLDYRAIYVTADPDTITNLPNLSSRDKHIIIDYMAQAQIKVRGSFCAVKNISSL
ncbi:MAG: hypothetical protein NTX82_06970 [Candidatus Parcubacteria bacterium]|nr:hypothetical protein [Candidatus Parcubacteria bacterium]